MTWEDFRKWAWEVYRFRLTDGSDLAWRWIWHRGGSVQDGRAGTGSGHYVTYGPVQQRRFALWLRARSLVHVFLLADWVKAGEDYDDGWLVNDGGGIRWVADPEAEALELVRRGFIAIKCGI